MPHRLSSLSIFNILGGRRMPTFVHFSQSSTHDHRNSYRTARAALIQLHHGHVCDSDCKTKSTRACLQGCFTFRDCFVSRKHHKGTHCKERVTIPIQMDKRLRRSN
ncbi:hypothetical protein K469DRAFT_226849 [Zopfia rhizophila CBS 207.26]|uniref:Uncharacterized protein n=1 Tax=Zopfia rhizophila CBS 207.26 TaxID=1314779 RepID=A0A6A6DYB4_9PEZI|nr:hypothetical protein K469DRAFT_226849 [Zopfia rhizophila CBS 207.26]